MFAGAWLWASAMVASAAPSAPSGLNSAGVKATSFTLRWSASTGGSGGIAGYEVFQNGSSLGSTTAKTFSVIGLAPLTNYTMTIVARDGGGNASPSSASLTVTTAADTSDPSRPGDLVATAVTANSFFITWSPSTDNVGVIGYYIYRAGTLVGASSGPLFQVGGLAADANHNVTVKAFDAAGNLSSASAVLSIRTLADPPTSPADLSTSNLKATSFTLHWAASTQGTGGIAGYDVFQNGVLVGSTAARSFALVGLAPVSTYNMAVVARDAAGNISAPSGVLPVTTAADTTDPAKPTGVAASGVSTTSFLLSWIAATDNVGVVGYIVYRSGTQIGSTAGTTLMIQGLSPDTDYHMTVKAVDAAGKFSGASAVLVVRTLSDPPSVPTGLMTANLKATSFTLKWTAATGGSGGIVGYDIYQDGLLRDSSSSRSLVVSGLLPSTSYQLSVASRDAAGHGSAPSGALVVTTLADTSAPSKPSNLAAARVMNTSFTLSWAAATDNVGVVSYNIYRNGALVGSSPTLEFDLVGLAPATAYRMTVKALDAAGHFSGASAALVVTTSATSNQLPMVSLTAPEDGAMYSLLATLTLTAAASDGDGTVGKVEFFNGAEKIGEDLSPPYELGWSPPAAGTYLISAKATDNLGGAASSATRTITVNEASGLPFIANFELSEGYRLGPLDTQLGWSVVGLAEVASSPVSGGLQAVAVAPSTPTALLVRAFVHNDPRTTFVDLFAMPAAAPAPAAGVFFETEAARVALTANGSAGIVQVFDGDGAGGGAWAVAASSLVLDTSGATTDWQRFTVRTDYSAKKWDLYLNGQMIAAELGFLDNSKNTFGGIGLSGHATLVTGFDDLLVAFENPLFADADHDGMDDAWEAVHGLDPSVNDRNADPDGDGLSNIREYLLGTDPQNADTDGDGTADGTEVANGTDPKTADAGGSSDSDGNGLPDAWEQQHFGHLGNNPAIDYDNDGLSNAEELALGTDPNDPTASDLVVTPILNTGGRLFDDNTMQVRVTNLSGQPVPNVLVRLRSLNNNRLEFESRTGSHLELRTDSQGMVKVKMVNGAPAGG